MTDFLVPEPPTIPDETKTRIPPNQDQQKINYRTLFASVIASTMVLLLVLAWSAFADVVIVEKFKGPSGSLVKGKLIYAIIITVIIILVLITLPKVVK